MDKSSVRKKRGRLAKQHRANGIIIAASNDASTLDESSYGRPSTDSLTRATQDVRWVSVRMSCSVCLSAVLQRLLLHRLCLSKFVTVSWLTAPPQSSAFSSSPRRLGFGHGAATSVKSIAQAVFPVIPHQTIRRYPRSVSVAETRMLTCQCVNLAKPDESPGQTPQS